MSPLFRYGFVFLLIPALLLVLPLAAQKGAKQGQWSAYSAEMPAPVTPQSIS